MNTVDYSIILGCLVLLAFLVWLVKEIGRPKFVIMSWEITEISIVTIPADNDIHFLSVGFQVRD